MKRVATLLTLLFLALGAAGDHVVTPDEVYQSESPPTNNTNVFIPNTAVIGAPLWLPLTGVLQAAHCAAACRETQPNCTYFQHCGEQVGCPDGRGTIMQYQECRLLKATCPAGQVMAMGEPANITSGFPVHHVPETLNGITSALAQGLAGADFNCSMSAAPGMCALTNTYTGLFMCATLAECQALVILPNGTDGCSTVPLTVLKNEVPTPSNTFVSPHAFTLVMSGGDEAQKDLFLEASQAEVTVPSEAEMANSTGSEAAYMGCSISRNVLLTGTVLGVVDSVLTPAACCNECHEQGGCTAWNYCDRQEGCRYFDNNVQQDTIFLSQWQCELRNQEFATALIGGPTMAIAKESEVHFTAGTPLTAYGPNIPGYDRFPGTGLFGHGRYMCEGTLRLETEECTLPGETVEQLGQACTADERCKAFALKTRLSSLAWSQQISDPYVGFLQNDSSESARLVIPSPVLYVKSERRFDNRDSSSDNSGSGGLSAGLMAGIAAGCSVAAVGLAAAAWLVRWRRRGLQQQLGEGLAPASSSSSSTKELSQDMESGCTADSGGLTSQGSGLGQDDGQPRPAIAELLTHVARQDAAAHVDEAAAAALGHSASCPLDATLLSADSLPASLREWVVDPSAVTYMRKPNGKLWEVGSGASSRVYKVMYRGEMVAAKEMDIGHSGGVQETFLTEAQLLQQLRHPNVVSFMGICISGETGTVLLEYCEGRDLFAAMEVITAGSSQRVFSWHRKGRRVALELAKAVNYLHSKGIVHMDIKSPNILLTATGTAKLSDVGFSRAQTHSFLSNVQPVGTFAWIAPEVLMGTEKCTQAVDIYSVGVVMWELITGERPARGNLRMPRVPEECPQEACNLMWDCLSHSPSERPTAQQLMLRLVDLQQQRPGGKQGAAAQAAAVVGRCSLRGSSQSSN